MMENRRPFLAPIAVVIVLAIVMLIHPPVLMRLQAFARSRLRFSTPRT